MMKYVVAVPAFTFVFGAVLPGEAAEPEAGQKLVDVGAETATHEELPPLEIEFERLTAMRLHPRGNLLACDGDAQHIKVIDASGKVVSTIDLDFQPEAIDVADDDASGKVVSTIDLDFQPEAIDVADDGTIYCGGQGRLAKLDSEGRMLRQIDLPRKERTPEEEQADFGHWAGRENRVSGIAVTDGDVFLAYGAGWSLRSRSKLFRLDRNLEDITLIAEDLRGCCQRCDIAARGKVVYVAENSRYRVVSFDREGNELGHFGGKSRKDLEDFGACCNPMNLDFDARGNLYTSESGIGRVKQYTADGEFRALIGYVGVERFTSAGHLAASCSNMAIAVTPEGKRVYVMDYKGNRVRVLQKKG